MYCVGRKPYDYAPYDDCRFVVTLLCGVPGSGKSTWVKQHLPGQPCVSLDDLREEFDVDPADGAAQGGIAREAKERAKQLLRAQQDFVWDATNLTRDLRSQMIALFASYGARTRIVYVEIPRDEAFRRNLKRERQVPQRVIERMYERLEIPTLVECHELLLLV